MKKKLTWRDRRDIRRGHNELALRVGRSRPTRGYLFRAIKEELEAILTPSTISWSDPRAAEVGRQFGEAMRRAKHYRPLDSEGEQS